MVHLAGAPPRPVHAIRATGEERERLWQRWLVTEPEIAGFADGRVVEAPVVVLEPRVASTLGNE